ncbi:hypothetical protein BDZ97DRAFT_1890043 [Flammula alnicola]|nr:hypothetical protein BDZ97DRAFT_1890043 [Flammula alnicola]
MPLFRISCWMKPVLEHFTLIATAFVPIFSAIASSPSHNTNLPRTTPTLSYSGSMVLDISRRTFERLPRKFMTPFLTLI